MTIHLENVEAMVEFFCQFNLLMSLCRLVEDALEVAGNFHNDRGCSIEDWVKFIYRLRRVSPRERLNRLVHGSTGGIWSSFLTLLCRNSAPNVLKTHLRVCNYLAENKLKLVRFEMAQSRHYIGLCNNDMQIGDKLIYVSGVRALFLVRGVTNSAKLISPVIMCTRRDDKELVNIKSVAPEDYVLR